ncbi:MAG: HD domain-containing protein [Chloroflexi bacterium]|nr:HD domain-containing protein [Chloroflexota bacterium]
MRVAHWVYPGATHSRLEHSIGVVHQVQRLVSAMNVSKTLIEPEQVSLLRVAALCHDMGHGVMSHVSENAFKDVKPCTALKLEFEDRFHVEGIQLSEIACYYMIGSPAFRRLLQTAMERHRDYPLPADAIGQMQRAITGQPISDRIPLLHELISGPFDADKLDYMPRDAHMSGVPVVTDVARLIQKTRALEVSEDALPRKVAAAITGRQPAGYVMTGIDLSGGRTLDELMLGRVLLFDKIYRHQKVRAAEGMVAALLQSVSDLVADTVAMVPFALTDEQLLDIDKGEIERLAGRTLTEDENIRVAVAVDLAHRLKVRDLFVRCLAFAQNMPDDPYKGIPTQRLGMEALLRDVADSTRRQALVHNIAQQVREIVDTLGRRPSLEQFPVDRLDPYICISPPAELPTPDSNVGRAFLIASDGSILDFKIESAESKGWSDAYLLARDVGYVFAPLEIAEYVFLAVERVLATEPLYRVRMPRTMLAYTKLDSAALDEIRRSLALSGFYATSPRDLWPLPQVLRRADIARRLEDLVKKLAGYHGPAVETDSSTALTLHPDRVRDWVRQFQTDRMADAALRVVEQVRLVGRPEIKQSLTDFMEGHPEFQGGCLCPFGLPKDSSAVTTYYAADIAERYRLTAASLPDALTTDKPILSTTS